MMVLTSMAHYIEFNHIDSSDQTLIVWKHDDPPAREDSRRKVAGIYFMIKNLTQLDSGLYTVRDKKGGIISTKSLVVSEHKMTLTRGIADKLRVGFDLEPNSCNIYFFPEDKEYTPVIVARRGKLLETFYCPGLTLLWPCQLENNNLEMSCSGRFEFRDLNDNKALVVRLHMEPPPSNKSYIGIGAGIFSAVLSCCCCFKRVCCRSSSKKDQSETPNDEEPAVYYHEYENEPVGPGPEQLSPTSYTPTVPLIHNPPTTYDTPAFSEIHNPPTMDDPPAFSEVYPPARQEDVPTVPVLSDPEPQFEVKGLTFPSAPPLSSDSTGCNVYTSDKLNFL
ncbi:hypothetical protein D9C73_006473 [Collichthys lucidus]|uniref:Uncharacterized protein n=1 Tax=Collichthys lucidus TaxID=240159 RepID=A0A4U5UDA2_COLLU|nr:hypothetical protein D9C73_006473 [Collichthys lucidus]